MLNAVKSWWKAEKEWGTFVTWLFFEILFGGGAPIIFKAISLWNQNEGTLDGQQFGGLEIFFLILVLVTTTLKDLIAKEGSKIFSRRNGTLTFITVVLILFMLTTTYMIAISTGVEPGDHIINASYLMLAV